jgi:hypothetical protein
MPSWELSFSVRAGSLDARSHGLQGSERVEVDTINPANLIFYRDHKSQILTMLEEFLETH